MYMYNSDVRYIFFFYIYLHLGEIDINSSREFGNVFIMFIYVG